MSTMMLIIAIMMMTTLVFVATPAAAAKSYYSYVRMQERHCEMAGQLLDKRTFAPNDGDSDRYCILPGAWTKLTGIDESPPEEGELDKLSQACKSLSGLLLIADGESHGDDRMCIFPGSRRQITDDAGFSDPKQCTNIGGSMLFGAGCILPDMYSEVSIREYAHEPSDFRCTRVPGASVIDTKETGSYCVVPGRFAHLLAEDLADDGYSGFVLDGVNMCTDKLGGWEVVKDRLCMVKAATMSMVPMQMIAAINQVKDRKCNRMWSKSSDGIVYGDMCILRRHLVTPVRMPQDLCANFHGVRLLSLGDDGNTEACIMDGLWTPWHTLVDDGSKIDQNNPSKYDDVMQAKCERLVRGSRYTDAKMKTIPTTDGGKKEVLVLGCVVRSALGVSSQSGDSDDESSPSVAVIVAVVMISVVVVVVIAYFVVCRKRSAHDAVLLDSGNYVATNA